MEESNKVVVKVKYNKSNLEQTKSASPDMVTEWHVGRILAAIVILVLIIGCFVYLVTGEAEQPIEQNSTQKENDIKSSAVNINKIENKQKKIVLRTPETIVNLLEPKQKNKREEKVVEPSIAIIKENKSTQLIVETKIKAHKNVARALLTKGIRNKEPTEEVILPLIISKETAGSMYYFTEIINMKGKTLYHQWFKEHKLVYERKMNILGNRWRASTSKLIPYSYTGMWNVRLIDSQGNILNNINFEVIKQQ